MQAEETTGPLFQRALPATSACVFPVPAPRCARPVRATPGRHPETLTRILLTPTATVSGDDTCNCGAFQEHLHQLTIGHLWTDVIIECNICQAT